MSKFYKILFILLMLTCQAQTIKMNQTTQTCQFQEDIPNWTYDGFCWFDQWVPGLPDYKTQFLEYPTLTIGKSVFYGPMVMEATAYYRGLNLKGYAGGVATMTCGDLGKSVWLRRSGFEWEGPFLVVDCARRNDLYGVIIYREEAIEVDFETALRWDMISYYDFMSGDYEVNQWMIRGVLVSKIRPDLLSLQTEIVNLPNWFLKNVTYSHGLMQDWKEWREIALPKVERLMPK